jgi:tetratricopeptide (TPR) repeat protein
VSLTVGFAVGVVIAFAAVSLRTRSEGPSAAAPAPVSLPPPTSSHSVELQPAARAIATPPAHPPSPPKASLAVTASHAAPTLAQERRWLLDRARSEQRQYRIAAAERSYRQILAHAPQDSEALSGLGELDLLRGTVDLADQHFKAALDANSHYIPALIAAADIRWQSGRTEEARQAYQDIVDHYSADSYPPYVALRSVPAATPVCER